MLVRTGLARHAAEQRYCRMKSAIKVSVFYAARACGLFALSRRIYRHKVRILCYHGFTLHNEHQFVPGLFIEPEVFRRRLHYLQTRGYRVQRLGDAFECIRNDAIAADTVVLTIDDGFYSVFSRAVPLLREFDVPATLYLTSYYLDEDCPVFTLAVDYMFWLTRDADMPDPSRLQVSGLTLTDASGRALRDASAVCERIKTHGQSLPDNAARSALLHRLGEWLGCDYQQLKSARLLNLVSNSEMRSLSRSGIDVQLHTHRHRFPVDPALARREIDDNRAAIEPGLGHDMRHFCYPSGEWDERHWPILREQGILTATTCTSGLVDSDTAPYAMPRILDSARVSQIEFEAEVSGFCELIRHVRSRFG